MIGSNRLKAHRRKASPCLVVPGDRFEKVGFASVLLTLTVWDSVFMRSSEVPFTVTPLSILEKTWTVMEAARVAVKRQFSRRACRRPREEQALLVEGCAVSRVGRPHAAIAAIAKIFMPSASRTGYTNLGNVNC
jgi:hypothetical protein